MQELKFEQVEYVSGGFDLSEDPRRVMTELANTFGGSQGGVDCITVPGNPLTPEAQALLGSIAAVASRLHITVAVGVAALGAYFNAYVQQDQVTCPTRFSQEELTEIINRGFMSGGPL